LTVHQYSLHAPDGTALRVRTWGGNPPRIFLIHGFGDGGFIWDRFAADASAYGPLAALDLRGHGDSGHDQKGRYPIARHAADVLFALDSLAARDVILMGHSLGTLVAIHACAALGNRAKALVLAEGGPFLRESALETIRAEFKRQSWFWPSIDRYVDSLIQRMPLAQPAMLRAIATQALRPTGDAGFVLKCDPALSESLEPVNSAALCSLLRELACPKLLLRGAMSSVLPRAAALNTQANVPDCRFITVERAGHALMLENPESFAALTLELLSSVRPGFNQHESAGRAG
jgi:pimeloyl-ACP methyl ester carboxylesterase